jgi:transmembrane sensor
MKDIFNISTLIIKKKLKNLSEDEKSRLKKYSKKYPFTKDIDFGNIVQKITDYSTIDNDSTWSSILDKLEKNHKKSLFSTAIQPWFKYAAMIAVFVGTGYIYINGFFNNDPIISIPDEVITLQLDNGNIKIISDKVNEKIVNTNGKVLGIQTGNTIDYKNNRSEEKLAYNTLTVPYGKRFELQLSDGTQVHLNAGTSLKYPVKFIKGQNRQVFLIGEAYFNVAEDKTHPFIVNTGELNVQVLGTQFNVSSYSEDNTSNVVLVEGSVSLFTNNQKFNTKTNTLLKPGFKGSYNKEQNTISQQKVVTSIYTSWIKGELLFREMTFENILKKLERHYNVKIINNNEVLSKEIFNASFVNEPIEKVFQNLKITYGIDFTIDTKNNILIIN